MCIVVDGLFLSFNTLLVRNGLTVFGCSYKVSTEQRARAGYEGVLKQCDDPDIIKPLQFLREREIVHYQRFGEALNIVQDKLNKKRCY